MDIVWELGLKKVVLNVDGNARLETTEMPYLKAARNGSISLTRTVSVRSAWGSRITIAKPNMPFLFLCKGGRVERVTDFLCNKKSERA